MITRVCWYSLQKASFNCTNAHPGPESRLRAWGGDALSRCSLAFHSYMQDRVALRDALLREVARHYHTALPAARQKQPRRWDDSFAAVLVAQQQSVAALMGSLKVCICANTS